MRGTFEEGRQPGLVRIVAMVFLFKRQNIAKKRAKIRYAYQCLGCLRIFRTRKALCAHQGTFWPFCPPVDN